MMVPCTFKWCPRHVGAAPLLLINAWSQPSARRRGSSPEHSAFPLLSSFSSFAVRYSGPHGHCTRDKLKEIASRESRIQLSRRLSGAVLHDTASRRFLCDHSCASGETCRALRRPYGERRAPGLVSPPPGGCPGAQALSAPRAPSSAWALATAAPACLVGADIFKLYLYSGLRRRRTSNMI